MREHIAAKVHTSYDEATFMSGSYPYLVMQQAKRQHYFSLLAIAVFLVLLVDIGQCLGTTKGGIDVHARNTSERKHSTFYDDALDLNNNTANAFSFYTPMAVVALILVIAALMYVSKRNENKH